MKTSIQVISISGRSIEEAKYETQIPWIQDKHEVFLSFPFDHQGMLTFLSGKDRPGILLDGDKEEGYSVTIKCQIISVKHIIDVKTNDSHTIINVSPINGNSEQVMLHCIDPTLCSANFLKAL